jgi:hypothetical protein
MRVLVQSKNQHRHCHRTQTRFGWTLAARDASPLERSGHKNGERHLKREPCCYYDALMPPRYGGFCKRV